MPHASSSRSSKSRNRRTSIRAIRTGDCSKATSKIHRGRWPREAVWDDVNSFCGFDWQYQVSLSEKNTQRYSKLPQTGGNPLSCWHWPLQCSVQRNEAAWQPNCWPQREHIMTYHVLFAFSCLFCTCKEPWPTTTPRIFSFDGAFDGQIKCWVIGLPAALGAVLSWFLRALWMSHDLLVWVCGSSTMVEDVLCHIESIWRLYSSDFNRSNPKNVNCLPQWYLAYYQLRIRSLENNMLVCHGPYDLCTWDPQFGPVTSLKWLA